MTGFFGLLLASFLQVLLPADDPNAAGAPPDDSVVLQIYTQPPSKIAEYKLTDVAAEEDRVLPPPSPPPPPSELHQPRKLQQTGADPVDDSDGQARRRQLRRRTTAPRVQIPSLQKRKRSLRKRNEELQIRKEEIERAIKGAFFTSAVSIGAMVSILTHPATPSENKQITLLDISLVSFFASLVTGILIPLFNICSCISIPLRLFRSMECATYFLLLLASLAAFIYFMGIMCILFALALVFVVAMIAYCIVRSE